MRKIKITEEQRQYALKEGVVLNADPTAYNGDVKQAVDKARQEAEKSGVDIENAKIQIPAAEGRIITKKQIAERNLRHLKKNSECYSVSEFVKRLGKCKVNEDLTNTQIRNVTGISDDDELNAAVECESAEELESDVWRSIAQVAGGNPRLNAFDFNDMAKVINEKYGFVYKGSDDEDESHIFKNDKYELTIYPKTFYPRQGMMKLDNMHLY